MFTLGVPEMAVIFLLALVLFGPKKLPELGRTIGKAMTEFRRASNDLKATFEREMHTLERENLSLHQATKDVARSIYDQVTYDHPPAESAGSPLEIESTATEPATVGASEVSGAESNGTTPEAENLSAEAAPVTVPAIEGTVPRGTHTGSEKPHDS
jgi:sec-independent protein translocase protein TatA